jgi:hypothetical protein
VGADADRTVKHLTYNTTHPDQSTTMDEINAWIILTKIKTDETGCGAAREYYFSSSSHDRHVADGKIRT